MYDRKEGVPAKMQHAGVISSLTSPDTGTYVPEGKDPPTGLTDRDMYVVAVSVMMSSTSA